MPDTTSPARWRRFSAALGTTRALTTVVAVGGVGLAIVLAAYEYLRWRDWDLGIDYSLYNQGTWLVSHGHLFTSETIYHSTFPKDQVIFELIGLLRALVPPGLIILEAQAIAVAATMALIVEASVLVSRGLQPAWRLAVVVAVALLVVTNPWPLQAVSFDVHVETFGALGLAIAALGVLASRRALATAGFVLALASGSAVVIVAAGFALGVAVAVSAWRRLALLGFALALAVELAVEAAGGPMGFAFAQNFGYLALGHHATVAGVALGILEHPTRLARVLASRVPLILQALEGGGILGLAWPPALVATLPALLVNASASGTNFLSVTEGFQNWPELSLLLIGSAIVLARLARRAAILGVGGLVLVVGLTLSWIGSTLSIPRSWFTQPYADVVALRTLHARVAPRAEVVATINAISRFGARPIVLFLGAPRFEVPVCASTVSIIVETAGPYAVLTPSQLATEAHALTKAAPPGSLFRQANVVAVTLSHLAANRIALELPTLATVGGRRARALDHGLCP